VTIAQQRHNPWRRARAPLGFVVGVSVVAAACGTGSGAREAEPDEPAPADDEPTAEPAQGEAAATMATEAGDADPQCEARSDGVLRIGGLLPETGDQALLGPAQRAGARLAVAEINQAGGVLGKPVEFLPGDSGDTSSTVARQTVSKHLDAGVDVILGATASSVTLDVIDEIIAACTIQFSPTSSSPELTTYDDGDLFFRTAPSHALQAQALAELVADDGHARLAVLARRDGYGRNLGEFTRQAFEGAGGTAVLDQSYDPQADSLEPEVSAVLQANPDALALIGFGESHRILSGLFKQGFTPDKKGIYLVDANVGDALGEHFQPGALVGVKGTLPAAEVSGDFRARLLFTAPNLRDLVYGPEAYDAVIITALATVAAGSDNAAAVARQINGVTRDGEACGAFARCAELLRAGKDIDYSGPSGPQDLSRAGEPTTASFAVVSYGENNRIDRSLTTYRFATLSSTGPSTEVAE
jgi:branched-chain amino acid transport system substrate-binding protein